jgi:hypothetical protein
MDPFHSPFIFNPPRDSAREDSQFEADERALFSRSRKAIEAIEIELRRERSFLDILFNSRKLG